MNSGIYRIYWPIQGYFYYGQSINLKRRNLEHFKKLKSNKHKNRKLQSIFNKHGLPLFEVVEYCEVVNLDKKEQFYISKYFNDKFCCNLSPDSKTCRGVKWSEESKKRHSENRIGIKSTYTRTIEERKIISNRLSGRVLSEVTKEKLRLANLGKKYSNDVNKKKGKDQRGIKNVNFGKPSPFRKQVLCTGLNGENKIIYDSIQIAQEASGINRFQIRAVCNGIYKQTKGFLFSFI